MIVAIKSKQQFDEFMNLHNIDDINVESINACFISINDSTGTDEIPYFKENKSNVLVLFFDDITAPMSVEYNGNTVVLKHFDSEIASKIIEFMELNKDKNTCIIHCAAGISRSGAVGEFVNDIYGEDYQTFKQRNPRIMPNSLVFTTLKRMYNNQNIYDEQ